VPQFNVEVDRIKTQTLHVTTDQIFSTLSSYVGASFVNQFTKFGRTFQVYTQADAKYRLSLRDIENLMVRNSNGDMIPLGTVAKITPTVGPSLISLYNLYPSATRRRRSAGRSTMCSASRCSWSISCSPVSTRAGTRRSRCCSRCRCR